jgi:hypothetical protein
MMFTNSLMIIRVNKTTNWPVMNSMAIGRYKNTNATNPKGGYWKPYVVTTQIPDHRDGQFVRPNKVAFEYLDFKKEVNPNAHVRVFNFAMKANVKTSKEYIINVFNYMLRNTSSN